MTVNRSNHQDSTRMSHTHCRTRMEAQPPVQATPIWLAALIATRCQASRRGEDAMVSWNWLAGKAIYTNAGADPEMIQPLGVTLHGGQTLAVSWIPGDTAYTLEVFAQ